MNSQAEQTLTNENKIATQAELAGANFEALITTQEAEELEQIAQNWGVARRIALGILTRSKADLVASITSDEVADALLGSLDDLRDLIQVLKNQTEFSSTAEVRLLCALTAYSEQNGGAA